MLSLLGLPAAAQGLRTLHVQALTMRTDRAVVAVGEDFHLTIHVRVAERVAELDDLVIPDVGTMHVLGDERHVTHDSAGTDVDEVLTLEPAEPGLVAIAGATLDAVDARTGKPTRFTADPVRIRVGPVTGGPPWERVIAGLVLAVALVIMGVLALVRIARSRRSQPSAPAQAAVVVPSPAVAPSPRDSVRAALHAYRAQPSRITLHALRAELYRASGAAPGATLLDALRTVHDERLIAALREADTAAFAPPPAFKNGAQAHEDGAALTTAVEAWLR